MEIKSLEMGMPLVQELLRERTRLQARVTELEGELIYTKLSHKTESKEGTCSGVERNAVVVREARLGKRVREDCSKCEFGESANDESRKRIEELENGFKSMQEKKEKEQLQARILALERKLDEKQALELEIQRLKGSLEVMRHMGEDGDVTLRKKLEAIQDELEEVQGNYDDSEKCNQILMIQNDELQEVRKELIMCFSEFKAHADIGIKRMGELDEKPFHDVAETKFSDENKANEWVATMHSTWEEHIRDQCWRPFKILYDEDGRWKACFKFLFMPEPLKRFQFSYVVQDIIDEGDERLKGLKACGAEVYNAVTRALMEMNEYDPRGRNIVRELWNFKEDRKARLKEAMELLLERSKRLKRKRA
uniref:Factor of DNA methylation 4-like A n=1 Tax=Hypericum perforatum TaxID=65561 RepID=A0A4Y5U3F1_HYPPE|nr:factor of DNA methylation 4-like A [Hypericum perforatum]